MLKGIDPILNAEVLHALRAMGHGDDLILCDTNFPAQSVARRTVLRAAAPDRRAAGAGGEGGALGLSARQLRRRRGGADGDRGRPRRPSPRCSARCRPRSTRAEGKAWPMIGDRALRLLRAGEAGLCGDPDRRAALLRLLRAPQGRDPAGGLRWGARTASSSSASSSPTPPIAPTGRRGWARPSSGGASSSGRAARARTRRWPRRGSGRR